METVGRRREREPPRFSPDGSQVAWTSWRDRDPEIYIVNADGSAPRRLTYWGDWKTRTAGPGRARCWRFPRWASPHASTAGPMRCRLTGRPAAWRTARWPTCRSAAWRGGGLAGGKRGAADRPDGPRPGVLEALPGRHGTAVDGDRARQPTFGRVLAGPGRAGRGPDAHRGTAVLPRRPRRHRQHLLLHARRRRPAQAHRPRRLLRAQPGHRRAAHRLSHSPATSGCWMPPTWPRSRQARHRPRLPVGRARPEDHHRRRPPWRDDARRDRAGQRR